MIRILCKQSSISNNLFSKNFSTSILKYSYKIQNSTVNCSLVSNKSFLIKKLSTNSNSGEKLTLSQKAKAMIKEYGAVFVTVYLSVYVTVLFSIFALYEYDIANASAIGIDTDKAIQKVYLYL